MLNDDQLLDARDMAEEMKQARAAEIPIAEPPSYADDHCARHEVYNSGCSDCISVWLDNAHSRQGGVLDIDESVLRDVDTVVEQVARPRTVLDVLAEWQNACEAEHKALPRNLEVLACASPLLLRLSALGNRLIYEAHDAGIRQVMNVTVERLKG